MAIEKVRSGVDSIFSLLPFDGSKTTIGGALVGIAAILKGLIIIVPELEPTLSPLVQALDSIGVTTAAVGISHKAVK